jgi:hypothetical protein
MSAGFLRLAFWLTASLISVSGFAVGSQAGPADNSAIIALVKKAVAPTKVTVAPVVQVDSYAIAVWRGNGGQEGGQALLVDKNRWSLISSGGGCLANVAHLKAQGVPGPTATALVKQLGKYGC